MLGLFDESEYACSVALRLAEHPRFTGSLGEARAREFVAGELSSMGYEVRLEGFKVKVFEILRAEPEVVSARYAGWPFNGGLWNFATKSSWASSATSAHTARLRTCALLIGTTRYSAREGCAT